jgi:NodT family efflux transporter outer membrane factor (OMF) lipoprotein
MRRYTLFMTAFLGLTLLSGCTVGPTFKGAEPTAPPNWHDVSTTPSGADHIATDADPDPQWWLSFNDPILSALIDRATQGNPDLQIAAIRIAEARASERSTASAGLPKLTADGDYRRADLGQGLFGGSLGPQGGNASSTSGLVGSLSKPSNIYVGALDASWELDLFGKVRRSIEAAHAATDVAIGNRDDALVTLEAEVSRLTAQSDFDAEQQVLALTQDRALHGLVSDLDVENARTAVASTEASVAQYDRQISSNLNGLAVLVGVAPGALDAELTAAAPIPQAPPMVPIGLPSGLAHRRPDIRAAEARLHQETANIGLADAQFYPDVSLSGQGGVLGFEPQALTNWADRFYAFGPAISLPIFQGGQLRANLQLATAEQAEAAVAYRKTVLGALEDVENALAAYRTELRRHQALERTVEAQAAALDIARDQYSHGVSTFINVLTAETGLAQQHQALIESTLSLTTNVVNLYKALGGGWRARVAPS